MTLRSRLAVGLLTIAVILVGPLIFAIQSLERLHRDARDLRDREVNASSLLGRLREGMADLHRQELALLFSRDVASRDAMAMTIADVEGFADSLGSFGLESSARVISNAIREVAAAAPREYAAALQGQTKIADSISANHLVPALAKADSGVLVSERLLHARTQQRVNVAANNISDTVNLSIVALILALLIAGSVAFWLTRSISEPVLELRAGMRAVADGELNYHLNFPKHRADEFSQLAESFDEMTRQLSELDKLKAEFVSVASHELKTPINVMIGYLQLLEDGLYGKLTKQQKEVLATLVLQSNTLLRLVRQLLDVSRFEAGGGRLEPRHVDLPRLLIELEDTFRVLAIQREVQFRITHGDNLPDDVTWDPDRVNEVLGNLLANAFKFTPRGGTVELSVDGVDGSVSIEVADTGAGIPPDQLPRIFDKFYQADNQRDAASGGSGLGLAIAKQIVEAHGGTIQCESTPGVGTTFTIGLPIAARRRTSARQNATAAAL
jgi:signal transduction histidine kinase